MTQISIRDIRAYLLYMASYSHLIEFMKKRTIQKMIWGFIVFIVIVSMLVWTLGMAFMN
jgi:hypothetical protein